MKHIDKAVISKLRSDATLQGLLGGASAKTPHMVDEKINAIYPCLAICHEKSRPAIPNGPSKIKKTLYTAYAHADTKTKVIDILDRLLFLLEAEGEENRKNYLDFSNADVCCKYTENLGMVDDISFVSSPDIYYGGVAFIVTWIRK